MRFGVIQCPACKYAKGILLGSNTTTCTRCQKRINLKNARIFIEADSESELAQVVGEINLRISEGESIYQRDVRALSLDRDENPTENNDPPNVYDRIAGLLNDISGKDKKIIAAAEALFRELGSFSEDDFNKVLIKAGFKDDVGLKKYLKKLLDNDVIYQPKIGTYMFIEG